MNRTGTLSVLVLVAGLALVGCGHTPSASPVHAPDRAPAFTGTPLAWLNSDARPWNGRLNGDQAAIDAATASADRQGADPYFAHLRAACTRMLDDAVRAQDEPAAPSAPLDQAWKAMTGRTERYATDCVKLTHTGADADLTKWQDSLSAMNTANATLNAVVAGVRGGTAGG